MPNDVRGRTDPGEDRAAIPVQLRPTVYCPSQRVHACVARHDGSAPRTTDA